MCSLFTELQGKKVACCDFLCKFLPSKGEAVSSGLFVADGILFRTELMDKSKHTVLNTEKLWYSKITLTFLLLP